MLKDYTLIKLSDYTFNDSLFIDGKKINVTNLLIDDLMVICGIATKIQNDNKAGKEIAKEIENDAFALINLLIENKSANYLKPSENEQKIKIVASMFIDEIKRRGYLNVENN
jgi:hypothetical protein